VIDVARRRPPLPRDPSQLRRCHRASTDTDLVPALAAVCEQRRAWGKPDLEVVAFDGNPKRLRVDAERIRCHSLSFAEFRSVEDRTNYRLPKKP
jgi:hypothetical protein